MTAHTRAQAQTHTSYITKKNVFRLFYFPQNTDSHELEILYPCFTNFIPNLAMQLISQTSILPSSTEKCFGLVLWIT